MFILHFVFRLISCPQILVNSKWPPENNSPTLLISPTPWIPPRDRYQINQFSQWHFCLIYGQSKTQFKRPCFGLSFLLRNRIWIGGIRDRSSWPVEIFENLGAKNLFILKQHDKFRFLRRFREWQVLRKDKLVNLQLLRWDRKVIKI